MIYLFNNKKELTKIIPRENLISATQDIELNGLYTSEVELPLFYKNEKGQVYNHKKSFDNASFYGHFDRREKFQMYKIYTRKVSNKNLIVGGIHLFFDEAKAMNIVRERLLTDVDARTAINTVFAGTGWTVKDYDTTPLKSIDFIYTTPLEARKTIIETWNVELDFDFDFNGRKITAKNITLRKKLGKWTGDRYKYGTNILRIEQEQDEAEVYTAAIGRGAGSGLEDSVMFTDFAWSKDGISKPIGQDYIEISSATAQYGYYDISGNLKPRIAIVEFDEPDRYVLANKTYEWLKQNCVPKVSYSTTVAKIGDYYLGDEIGIIYTEVDIVKKARVEKMTINLLNWNKTEIGLGDYSYFKQDKAKQNMKAEIKKVRKESIDGITKAKLEFDNAFNAQKQELESQINQVNINATAQVQAAETRMNEQLSAAKSDLSGQISNSYSSAVQAAELKAKELDAVVTNQINSTKTTLSNDITSAYNKAVTDAETKAKALDATITQTVVANKEAADKTMGELNIALGSTNSKVGTIEQNVTAAQGNISTLMNTTSTQQEAINQAKQDISGLTATVGGHTSDISTLNNQIVLKASKTEVTDAVNGLVIGGVNLLRKNGISNNNGVVDYSQYYDNGKIVFNTGGSLYAGIRIQATNLLPSTKYTISYKYRKLSGTLVAFGGHTDAAFKTDLGTYVDGRKTTAHVNTTSVFVADDTLTHKVVYTFETPATVNANDYFYIQPNRGSTTPVSVEITQWQLEEGIKATTYDISPFDRDALISQNAAAIVVANDEIIKRVTKTEFNTKTGEIEQTANTAKSTADSNSQTIATVKGNVDALSQWKADKGTAIDQTIDAVTTKVWQNDIDALDIGTRNLLLDSKKRSDVSGAENSAYRYIKYKLSSPLEVGKNYKLIFKYRILNGVPFNEISIRAFNPDTKTWTINSAEDVINTLNFQVTSAGATEILIYMGKIGTSNVATTNIEINEAMLVEGNKIGSYQPAPEDAENRMTEIKQTADGALTKATTIGNDYVKQSAVLVQSDGVLIGSKKVSGAEMASAISVTPSSVDIITKAMRITGDMAVAGDIKSLSLQAVNADIANLRANILTADSVTATALKVDSALITKLNTNSILTNYLTADNAMINSIKSNAVTAVRADIAWLKANVITADSITSTALKVDTALITKLNTNAILTNYLTADTAMISAIKSNAITAVRGDIAYLKSNIITADSIDSTAIKADISMINKLFAQDAFITTLTSKTAFIRDVEAMDILTRRLKAVDPNNPNRYSEILPTGAYFKGGNVTIETSSGRKVIINGNLNRSQTTTTRMPNFRTVNVEVIDNWYATNSTSWERAESEYVVHEARYFVMSCGINEWGYSMNVNARAKLASTGDLSNTITTYGMSGGSGYGWIKIDLGEPLDVPVSKEIHYEFRTSNGAGKGRMHLGNRFLTDNPPVG